METTEYSHFDLFTDKGIPVVFVDRIPPIPGIQKVHINNFNAGFEATEHLIRQGCKRIAHFGGARHQSIYEDRRLGYIPPLSTVHHPAEAMGEAAIYQALAMLGGEINTESTNRATLNTHVVVIASSNRKKEEAQ
ncbi:MAG: hypothetical protein DHS20C18_38000 [Saprospiraceae bacterium]|nr:MAG: hypothetical protein DHS20C18_38000 [Saprospiraceae bacterium]